MVSNPQIKDKAQRTEAIEALIGAMMKLAKNLGFSNIFTSVKVGKLINRLEGNGFQVADKSMTNLVKVL